MLLKILVGVQIVIWIAAVILAVKYSSSEHTED